MKRQKQQSDEKLSELIGRFSKINNDEQLNKMEMVRIDTEPKDDIDNGKYGHIT